MYRKLFLALSLISAPAAAYQAAPNSAPAAGPAGEASSAVAIAGTLEDYLAGFRDGNLARLQRAFAPDALLVLAANGRPVAGSPVSARISGWAAKPDPAARLTQVAITLIDESTASATFTLHYGGSQYRDQLSLLRSGGQWRVAVKVTTPQ
jgi:hypothetical protein